MKKTTTAQFSVFVLRCLLNYHERMMAGDRELRIGEINGNPVPDDGITVHDLYGAWAEGLKEAIRCVMIVHAGEVKSFPEWEKWVGIQEEKDPPEALQSENADTFHT